MKKIAKDEILKTFGLGEASTTDITKIQCLCTDLDPFLDLLIHEPAHDKTNKVTWVPSEDSDQPGRAPSLIRVFAVCMKKKHWVFSYPLSAQQRL